MPVGPPVQDDEQRKIRLGFDIDAVVPVHRWEVWERILASSSVRQPNAKPRGLRHKQRSARQRLAIYARKEKTVQIQKLTEEECFALLRRVQLARLACASDGQPYVVPIYLALSEVFLYGFSGPGQKIDWMRANPKVCLEWDEVANSLEWTSVVAFGEYEELPDLPELARERQFSHDLLQRNRGDWWQPGAASNRLRDCTNKIEVVYFRIRIGPLTGRRTTHWALDGGPGSRQRWSTCVRLRLLCIS